MWQFGSVSWKQKQSCLFGLNGFLTVTRLFVDLSLWGRKFRVVGSVRPSEQMRHKPSALEATGASVNCIKSQIAADQVGGKPKMKGSTLKLAMWRLVWRCTEDRSEEGAHQRCATCRWPRRRCVVGCRRSTSGRSFGQLPPPGPRSAAACREPADRCRPHSSSCVWRPKWWSPTPVWTEPEGWRGMQGNSGSLQLGAGRKSGSGAPGTLQSSRRGKNTRVSPSSIHLYL